VNLRPVIASLAGLLLLLSIPPLRRRLPGLRRCPAGLELLLWLGFVSLCLVALASGRTIRSTELSQATARAALNVAGQAVGSLLGPKALWMSAHEPGVELVTAGVVGLGCVVVAARAVTGLRRALQPRPRLGDWWEVKLSLGAAPPIQVRAASRFQLQPAPCAASDAVMDARAAALYFGVSRATVYRWARTGRLPSTRTSVGLRFSSDDLAAVARTPPQRRSTMRRSGIAP
jgi:excisionase family DNA binding protein